MSSCRLVADRLITIDKIYRRLNGDHTLVPNKDMNCCTGPSDRKWEHSPESLRTITIPVLPGLTYQLFYHTWDAIDRYRVLQQRNWLFRLYDVFLLLSISGMQSEHRKLNGVVNCFQFYVILMGIQRRIQTICCVGFKREHGNFSAIMFIMTYMFNVFLSFSMHPYIQSREAHPILSFSVVLKINISKFVSIYH